MAIDFATHKSIFERMASEMFRQLWETCGLHLRFEPGQVNDYKQEQALYKGDEDPGTSRFRNRSGGDDSTNQNPTENMCDRNPEDDVGWTV